eukprot:CAMPEP_0194676568 /NCGR_PEP_ID=MMETSP0295-20121207/8964_1 /TAXON_ID=39354 /ORGANISM="Heterosigma akashiwo, Strain CCMP2393" /LENGTH=67 /DNA_ID=CAMNT_0039561185 /DNA_START=815 /DNA_END=1019 /DNA_ORIENTATION=-
MEYRRYAEVDEVGQKAEYGLQNPGKGGGKEPQKKAGSRKLKHETPTRSDLVGKVVPDEQKSSATSRN